MVRCLKIEVINSLIENIKCCVVDNIKQNQSLSVSRSERSFSALRDVGSGFD